MPITISEFDEKISRIAQLADSFFNELYRYEGIKVDMVAWIPTTRRKWYFLKRKAGRMLSNLGLLYREPRHDLP
jgi:hypothetical protein